MSTKIFNAYRTAPGEPLWPLMRALRARGRIEAKAAIRKFYEMLAACELPTDPTKRLQIAHDRVRTKYREQLSSPHRNEFDFNVSIAVRELDGRLYLRAHCDMTMGTVLDFMRTFPAVLEEYEYWTTTDTRPGGVTLAQWEERRETWDRIIAAGWGDLLTLTIVDWDSFHEVDPYREMVEELRNA